MNQINHLNQDLFRKDCVDFYHEHLKNRLDQAFSDRYSQIDVVNTEDFDYFIICSFDKLDYHIQI